MKSIIFCLFGNVLIYSSFLKDNFVGYRILGWQSISFSTLNMSSYCILAFKVFGKSAVHIIEDPIYIMSHFSFFALKTLFPLVFGHLTNMSESRSLWIYLTWSSLKFLHVSFNGFHQILYGFGHYFFK